MLLLQDYLHSQHTDEAFFVCPHKLLGRSDNAMCMKPIVITVCRRKRNRDTATQSYYKRKQRILQLTDQVTSCTNFLCCSVLSLVYQPSLLFPLVPLLLQPVKR